ncbi:MAG: hypothetical protein EA383_10085 [Spirochaetaceae bacterium]|nr:MAG: hypothetical protein EA383_10085 [Spirochaetaceae bacterium]
MDGDDAHSHLEILPLEDVDPDGFEAGRGPARAWFLDLPLWFFIGTAVLLVAVIIRTLVWLLS